ncbi:hypothetical protein D5086_000153 [Populus alba]|uniref:Uncharacterized protein n=1 Tax=Populus alba TaxID=43335 RepID=A0ACC4CVJ3_POPAL
MAEDFHHRVSSSGGVRYIFQLQNRSLPRDEVTCDIALDCTRPWDESEFPYIDMGELSNDSSIGEEGLGKSDSSKDIVSDLLGHFCSTIAANIPSILLDGVAIFAPLNWILLELTHEL